MRIIYNNIIPFRGFKCMNFFGILFVRRNMNMTHYDINHEKIHTALMKEMFYIPFYIWYIIEYIIRLFQYCSLHTAYRQISFEREAYKNEDNIGYLNNREKFSWFKRYRGYFPIYNNRQYGK